MLLPDWGTPFKIITSLGLDFVLVIWTTEFSTFWKISGIEEDDDSGWEEEVAAVEKAERDDVVILPVIESNPFYWNRMVE